MMKQEVIMGGGQGEAHRDAQLARAVEKAAEDLASALKFTATEMFSVHPDAIEIANEELRGVGVMLVKRPRKT